jgi:hypothetical protein
MSGVIRGRVVSWMMRSAGEKPALSSFDILTSIKRGGAG